MPAVEPGEHLASERRHQHKRSETDGNGNQDPERNPDRRTRAGAGRGRPGTLDRRLRVRRRRVRHRLRTLRTRQRPRGHPARRRFRPPGRRRHDLPRRLGARGGGADRLRPPLRAPLLPGLREPGPGGARQAHDPDRQLHQRLHQPRPHQLLRGRPDRRAGEGALGRGRQARLLHQHRDRIGGGEGEAGRQEREAAERRQPPVRPQQLRHRPGDVPGGPPVPLAGDRLAGRPSTRPPWPTPRSSTRAGTARTTPPSLSRETSTSRGPRHGSRSTSARSRPGRPPPPPTSPRCVWPRRAASTTRTTSGTCRSSRCHGPPCRATTPMPTPSMSWRGCSPTAGPLRSTR